MFPNLSFYCPKLLMFKVNTLKLRTQKILILSHYDSKVDLSTGWFTAVLPSFILVYSSSLELLSMDKLISTRTAVSSLKCS